MSQHIVIEGNLAADPETAVSPKGNTWTRFRVITNDRYTDRDGTWIDGPAVAYDVRAFRRTAENITDSLHTGDRVIIAGQLTTREYRDRDGNTRTNRELLADHVGAALTLATLTITRNTTRPNTSADAADTTPVDPAESPF